jgi:hypothetical protein
MSNKQGIIRMKIEYEEEPVMDLKTKKLKDLDEVFEIIKKKLR